VRSLRNWALVVAIVTLGVALAHGAISLAVRHLCIEYVVVVENVPYEEARLHPWWSAVRGLNRGLGVGLALGTLLGACATVARRRPAPLKACLLAAAAVPVMTALWAALGLVASAAYGKLVSPSLPAMVHAQIGRPYRVFSCYGITWASSVGAWATTVAACWWLRRQRAANCHGPEHLSE